jgi:hypothetical protein
MTSLAPLLPSVKVLYLEYDSRAARKTLADLIEPTHELYTGMEFLDQGECIYLRADLADLPEAHARLQQMEAEAAPGHQPPEDEADAIDVSPDLGSQRDRSLALTEGAYPRLPFVDDVAVVLDAGARYGAATVVMAGHHPTARIHAFEPDAGRVQYVERNTAGLPNVAVHPFGLGEHDHETGPAVRTARHWLADESIDRVDVLKVTAGTNGTDVLAGLSDVLPTAKVVYLEYASRHERRAVAQRLEPTHDLYRGHLLLDHGDCIYLHKDLSHRPEANEHLLRLFSGG